MAPMLDVCSCNPAEMRMYTFELGFLPANTCCVMNWCDLKEMALVKGHINIKGDYF
jgi:hypothetical protein